MLSMTVDQKKVIEELTTEKKATVEKPPMLTGPKRQHFLPRFYLDKFGRDGVLAVYDRDLNEIRMQRPENTGVIGHFYTIEDDQGRKRYELEHVLSEAEAKAAPIIAKLAAKQSLTEDERGDMAIFVALGLCRTPDLVESIKRMHGQMIKSMSKIMFSEIEQVKQQLRRGKDSPTKEEDLDQQAKELIEFVEADQYTIETDHQWALGMSMEMFAKIAPILAGRDWLIVHRDSEKRSFITTDAPLVLTTTNPRENNFWGIGFANPDALVLFPLTESCALLISGNKGDFNHRVIGANQIRDFNLMVADRCQRFVIGRDATLIKSLADRLKLSEKKWEPKMRVG